MKRPTSRHGLAVAIRLPYPPYLWTLVRRSVGVWLLIRIAYGVVLMVAALVFDFLPVAEAIARVVHPLWTTRILLVAFTAVLVRVERTRFHEVMLPANLGAWGGWFWTASLLSALGMDVAVQVFLGLL